MSRHRVVVIGSGFGGLTATKALKNARGGSKCFPT